MAAQIRQLDELKDLYERSGLSLQAIAEQASVGKSTVSMIVRGEYPSPNAPAVDAVRRVLEDAVRAKEPDWPAVRALPLKPQTFMTEAQQTLQAFLEDAYRYRDMAVLTGVSGMGKTFAAESWAAGREDALYIKVPERNTYGGLLDALLEAMGGALSGTISAKAARIKSLLRERQVRMIIVDEADLFLRGKPVVFLNKIGLFRELHADGRGPAVVFLGLPILRDAASGMLDTYIWSRIGHIVQLPRPSVRDLTEFWSWLSGRTPTAADAAAVSLADARGAFRLLKKIHDRASVIGIEDALGLFRFQGAAA